MREAQLDERDKEIDRLKRENERFRREEQDRSARNTGTQSQAMRSSEPEGALSEQDVTSSRSAMPETQQVRQAQRKLSEMGYHAGHADGILGAETGSAISEFRRSEGLAVTGQLNEPTLEALGIERSENESKR
jgi:peptidoglycan hydrolase-like protein with peptidoglycan-binding domain